MTQTDPLKPLLLFHIMTHVTERGVTMDISAGPYYQYYQKNFNKVVKNNGHYNE